MLDRFLHQPRCEVADISGPPSSFLESNSDDDNFEDDDDRSPLACLSETLRTLNLSDNEFEDPGAVRPALSALRGTLVELDLREREHVSEPMRTAS